MKTCRICGRVNSDTAQHCIQCGNLLPQQSDNMQSNGNISNMGNMVQTKSNGLFRNAGAKLKVLAIVVFVVVIIGGLIGGISIIAMGADAYFGGGFLITIGIIMILVSPLIGC